MVSWTKDGQPIDTKKVNVRNSDKDSIFFIRAAERADSGVYEMCVKVDSFEDKSQLTLQIVGKCFAHTVVCSIFHHLRFFTHVSRWPELPGPPASIKIVDTWGFNVALEWTEPRDNGNTTITGYTIQKADKKTGVQHQATSSVIWGRHEDVMMCLCCGLSAGLVHRTGTLSQNERHHLGSHHG